MHHKYKIIIDDEIKYFTDDWQIFINYILYTDSELRKTKSFRVIGYTADMTDSLIAEFDTEIFDGDI